MPNRYRAVILAVLLLPVACTNEIGHDFARIDPQRLVFGQTTESEIVALDGEPTEWIATDTKLDTIETLIPFNQAPVEGVRDLLRYQYLTSPLGDAHGVKVSLFYFKNHQL